MKEDGENSLVFLKVGFRRAKWLSDSSAKRICLAVTIFEIGRSKTEIYTDLQLSQIQFGVFWFVLHLLVFAAFVTLSIQIDTPGNKTASPEKITVYLAIWLGWATIFVLLWLRSWAPLTW
jgi:hypothetical protein